MALDFGAATLPLGSLEGEARIILAPSVARVPDETIDEVMNEIAARRAVLWVVSEARTIRSMAVTRIVGRVCTIWHCAGSGAREWVKFLRVIALWAESQGCDSIDWTGRKGWDRLTDYRLRKAL